jgi:hypothetical protein
VGTSDSQVSAIISWKVRLLSAITGFFLAIGGSLIMGIFSSIGPILLIVGAIIQVNWHSLGRGLMLSGALLMSVNAVLFAFAIANGFRTLGRYHDIGIVAVLLYMVVSLILVAWCDVALAMSEIRMRHSEKTKPSGSR